MTKSIALKPRLSEKAYALSQQQNTYVFDVPSRLSKQELSQLITGQYQVGIVKIRVSSLPGKAKRSYHRGSRSWHKGSSSNVRKAYITLKKDDKLPFFAALEDSEKKKTRKDKN